jgi:hypothetical protein
MATYLITSNKMSILVVGNDTKRSVPPKACARSNEAHAKRRVGNVMHVPDLGCENGNEKAMCMFA